MTLQEQLKGIRQLMSVCDDSHKDLLTHVKATIEIVEHTHRNRKSEVYIVSMSAVDYKQFLEYKNFKQFVTKAEKEEIKQATAQNEPVAVEPSTDNATGDNTTEKSSPVITPEPV